MKSDPSTTDDAPANAPPDTGRPRHPLVLLARHVLVPAVVLGLALAWFMGSCIVPEVRVYLGHDLDREMHTREVFVLLAIGMQIGGLLILRACPRLPLALTLGAIAPLVAMAVLTLNALVQVNHIDSLASVRNEVTSGAFFRHARDTIEFCLSATWYMPVPVGMVSGAVLLRLASQTLPVPTNDELLGNEAS